MPKSRGRQSRRVTPWDSDTERTPTQQFLYDHYKSHYQERHPALNTTGEDKLINSFVPETCPGCNSVSFQKYGRTHNNIQRYRCNDCGKTFTPVTGTVFDQHRGSLQGYLNLFSLAMNPPADNLEKVEILLNFAFKCRKTLRYRSSYRTE